MLTGSNGQQTLVAVEIVVYSFCLGTIFMIPLLISEDEFDEQRRRLL
jgi:hypothetical protein